MAGRFKYDNKVFEVISGQVFEKGQVIERQG